MALCLFTYGGYLGVFYAQLYITLGFGWCPAGLHTKKGGGILGIFCPIIYGTLGLGGCIANIMWYGVFPEFYT